MTFDTFYQAQRGRSAFPWMRRLSAEMIAGSLPTVIDLPTGSGKSDIVFVWAWARKVNQDLPRRLWMVSDRRIIVDQSYEAAKILQGIDGILISRLRGGIVSDDDAMLDPVRPQIISTTIDQLGSRLLFRGFGSSPRAWPIWAALAGTDSLIVLDEAHLSPIAEDTFRACQQRLGARVHVISMSATPRTVVGVTFSIDASDRKHPILGRRLAAKRFVELREQRSLADAANELLAEGCKRVAIVCNTVSAARVAFERVKHSDKHLLIGRQRPLDRDRVLVDLLPRLRSGAGSSPPLVLVATQCIEAGADFDFDGMVSEACPIDALLQRLGRLDRLGSRCQSRCILFKPQTKEVPPYGSAPDAAWRWLAKMAKPQAKRKVIDCGYQAWCDLRGLAPDEARSPRPDPVTFLEPHLRMLTRTSPRPFVEPDINLLLHGKDRAPGAISLVWRRERVIEEGDAAAATEILSILPPSALESCEVPLWEVKAWLAGMPSGIDSGDVEGGILPVEVSIEVGSDLKVLRWDGVQDGATSITPDQLRAGDVVVLPSAWGGYDSYGWNPASTAPVPDLADQAHLARTGRAVERHDDSDADVEGDRIHRWSTGLVVETVPADQKNRFARAIEVTLEKHRRAVADRAKSYAEQLGLDGEVAFQAGLYHDDGKADWRWQLCVNGGRLDRLIEPPLAKGPYVRSPLARLPSRWRHEAESLARLPTEASALVRWLVATHHGYARPFWPSFHHGLGLAELMDRLQAEHGAWQLALYEAVVRCADRAVSQEEELAAHASY